MRKRKLSNTVIFVIGFLTANCLIKFLRKCMSRHFENVLSSFFEFEWFPSRIYSAAALWNKMTPRLDVLRIWIDFCKHFPIIKFRFTQEGIYRYLLHIHINIVYSYYSTLCKFPFGENFNHCGLIFTFVCANFSDKNRMYDTDQKLWENSHGVGGGPTVRENTITDNQPPTVSYSPTFIFIHICSIHLEI